MSELADIATIQGTAPQNKRRRNIIISVVVILFNVGLAALLLALVLTPVSHPPSDPLVGHHAPGFTLAMLRPQAGKSSLSLADFKGRPVVLNFWASWCDPCKQEAPLLENSWKQVQAQGKDVVILGIDFQESISAGASFLRQYGITYQSVADARGTAADAYGVTSLPATIFINRSGTVVSRVPGQLTAKVLASNLKLIV